MWELYCTDTDACMSSHFPVVFPQCWNWGWRLHVLLRQHVQYRLREAHLLWVDPGQHGCRWGTRRLEGVRHWNRHAGHEAGRHYGEDAARDVSLCGPGKMWFAWNQFQTFKLETIQRVFVLFSLHLSDFAPLLPAVEIIVTVPLVLTGWHGGGKVTQQAVNKIACNPPHEGIFHSRGGSCSELCSAGRSHWQGVSVFHWEAQQGKENYLDDLLAVC